MLSVGRSPEVYNRDNWAAAVHVTDTEQAEFWLQIPSIIIIVIIIIITFL